MKMRIMYLYIHQDQIEVLSLDSSNSFQSIFSQCDVIFNRFGDVLLADVFQTQSRHILSLPERGLVLLSGETECRQDVWH